MVNMRFLVDDDSLDQHDVEITDRRFPSQQLCSGSMLQPSQGVDSLPFAPYQPQHSGFFNFLSACAPSQVRLSAETIQRRRPRTGGGGGGVGSDL